MAEIACSKKSLAPAVAAFAASWACCCASASASCAGAFVDCSECRYSSPSSAAAEIMLGFDGTKCDSKVQLLDGVTSATISPDVSDHASDRPSLPDERRRSESAGQKLTERMPLSWPRRICGGAIG